MPESTADPQSEGGNSPSLEFDPLRAYGIRQLERLATGEWTDFNTHDPGITILEQVCWALTDLGYRLGHPIPDLLAEGGGDGARGIASPAAALGCEPVTVDDLRRLVLDVDGVRNVWIEADEEPAPALHYHRERRTLGTKPMAAETQPLELRGLWRVLVDGSNLGDRQDGAVIGEIARRLFAHRPLCQDFTDIDVLAAEGIAVQADIEIGTVTDAESLHVEVLARIAEHISARVRFSTLQEREADGAALEDMFDGPPLRHGFVADADMPGGERQLSLHTSDLIRVIMDVPGVRAVRHIRLAKAAADIAEGDWQEWVLDQLAPNKVPRLELRPERIRLYRDQMPVRTDPGRVIERFDAGAAVAARRLPHASELSPPPPAGRNRHIGRYRSILHQFPGVYGVGAAGLSPQASTLRRAQAKQLKAYLQLFDQLLADCFAQAANAAGLLASDDPKTPVYAAGRIEPDDLGLDAVRFDPAGYQDAMEAGARERGASAQGIGLRRRQLDHLLARVGETFVDPVRPDAGAGAEAGGWDGLAERRALLAGIAELSAARGSAADSTRPFGEDNRSGLERRIALKLGLRPEEGETFHLVEHILLRAVADPAGRYGDDQQTEPLLRDVAAPDPYSLQLSFVLPAGRGRFADGSDGGGREGEDGGSGAGASDPRVGFRRFVEHVVRMETPAHLTAYVHWLDDEPFTAFEQGLARWHERRRLALLRRFNIQDPETGR